MDAGRIGIYPSQHPQKSFMENVILSIYKEFIVYKNVSGTLFSEIAR
jgi:hypothetical protein